MVTDGGGGRTVMVTVTDSGVSFSLDSLMFFKFAVWINNYS